MSSFASAITLPNLISVPLSGSGCLLAADQLAQLGQLLLRTRPQDPQAVCFLGGMLGALTSNTGPGAQHLVSLQGNQQDEPFMVIASRHGVLALLVVAEADGRTFRTRISTDTDVVDRAALVLAQLGDYDYDFDAIVDTESQRMYVASLVAAILTERALQGIDLTALLPDEQRWLQIARALVGQHNAAACLSLPAIRQALQEWGTARAVLGQLDTYSQQLLTLASLGGDAPAQLGVHGWGLGGVARTLTLNPNQPVPAAEWLRGNAIIAAPLPRDGRVWGVLLVASERSFSGSARAGLAGLGVLLAHTLAVESRGATITGSTMPPSPPIPMTTLPGPAVPPPPRPAAPLPGPAVPPPPRPAAPLPGPAVPPPPRPAAPLPGPAVPPPPRPAAPLPGPTVPTPTPAAVRNGDTPRTAANQPVVQSLLKHIDDSVIVVDMLGRIVATSPSVSQLNWFSEQAIGSALIDGTTAFLGPLLASTLSGDGDGDHEVTLPDGELATVSVVSLDASSWAFVIRHHNIPASSKSVAAPNISTVSDTDRIERFLTTFSNGIRAPLRGLRDLIAQVSAAGGLSEQQSRLIGQVVRQNSEIMMLVNDLFALGQMRLQTPENRMPLRIELLVDAAVGTQYAEYGRRSQQMTTNFAPNLPLVPASEEGLWRAVSALIDNAIKYSPNGASIIVDITARNKEVIVSVSDTGLGLSPEELEQVFDPFFRAQSAEQLDVPGRGLGLAITRAVIEQHGGHIWADSTHGQGSTFAFSLPCV